MSDCVASKKVRRDPNLPLMENKKTVEQLLYATMQCVVRLAAGRRGLGIHNAMYRGEI
jgi:hypothetical protein